MKKRFLLFIMVALTIPLLAEDFFERFLETNNSLSSGTGFIAVQKLIETDLQTGEKKITNAKSIFSGDKEFTILKDTKEICILNTNAGYWMKNSRTKNPIKISGSYAVDEIQMQDILRIDFQNDYKVEEKSENEILLRRMNKKNSYEYILLTEEIENNRKFYFAHALDSNKKEIKQIKYFEDVIDGVKCFSEIQIKNSTISKNKLSTFKTESLKPIKISSSLFKPEFMDELKKNVEK